MNIKQTISLEEVKAEDYYSDLAELARIFNHEICEREDGVWVFKPNRLMCVLHENVPVYTGPVYTCHQGDYFRARLDLNTLWEDLRGEKFSIEELVKFCMCIGSTLN